MRASGCDGGAKKEEPIVKLTRYLSAALALVLALSLTACGADSPKFERGVVDGQTYTSDFLKLTCTVPAEFSYLTDAEMAEINNIAADNLSDTDLAQQLQDNLENGSQVQDMYAMTEGGLQTINVMLSKVDAQGAEVDMAAFADLSMEQAKTAYQSMGMTDVEGSRETVTFMGQQYEGIRLTATYDGNAPVYCVQVYMQEGDYVCVVTFTSYIEDTTADMMGYFSPLNAETK